MSNSDPNTGKATAADRCRATGRRLCSRACDWGAPGVVALGGGRSASAAVHRRGDARLPALPLGVDAVVTRRIVLGSVPRRHDGCADDRDQPDERELTSAVRGLNIPVALDAVRHARVCDQ